MASVGPKEALPRPPFTIKDVRDAIPAHLFERSALKSSVYLVTDILIVLGLFWTASLIPSFSTEVQFVLWPLYWLVQGCVMTGIWVIAHECGHQSFSDSKFINNAVGLVFHSLLLVPYHSWRITHGMHHKGTAHMEKDQVFVPARKSKVLQRFGVQDISELIEVSPLASLIGIFIMAVLGWPGYLLFNIASQDYKSRANHFEPDSPMFKKSQHGDVLLSDIGLVVVGAGLYYLSWTYGFLTVFKYYGAPYLWVNFWLVLITYLQHTHKNVPHYRGDEWTFLRGAISTVDRDYGILNHVFHHITDSHVAHHLFSTMPHYNAVEATKYIKAFLGKYYLEDNTPIAKALWESWTTCHYVEDEGDVLMYQTIGKKKQ